MDALDAAKAAVVAAQQVVTDLEGEAPAPAPAPSSEFQASAIVNADGSVIVTLTPVAPAAVSDTATGEAGTVTEVASETSDTGPQPTGQ